PHVSSRLALTAAVRRLRAPRRLALRAVPSAHPRARGAALLAVRARARLRSGELQLPAAAKTPGAAALGGCLRGTAAPGRAPSEIPRLASAGARAGPSAGGAPGRRRGAGDSCPRRPTPPAARAAARLQPGRAAGPRDPGGAAAGAGARTAD